MYSEATLGLNLEQDAIYRRLIDWYMLNRMPLPCQPIALARICQISLEKWHEHSEMILSFFRKRGERFHHKRCDIELDRQDSTSKRLGEAAKKAHEARRKNKASSYSYMPSQSQGDAEANAEERRGRGEVEESSTYVEDIAPPQIANGASHAKPRRKPTTFISEDFGGDLGCIALAGKLLSISSTNSEDSSTTGLEKAKPVPTGKPLSEHGLTTLRNIARSASSGTLMDDKALEMLLVQLLTSSRFVSKAKVSHVYGDGGGYDVEVVGYEIALDALHDGELKLYDALEFLNRPATPDFVAKQVGRLQAVMARRSESNSDLAVWWTHTRRILNDIRQTLWHRSAGRLSTVASGSRW